MSEYKLSHLKELESESIHIIREVAAEFENPVMLYSIGKDSSVMVRLAEKAFAPGKVPFPLMHIDSKWKFKEMIEFRDKYAQEHNWNLIVEYNKEAYEAGVGPFTHGSKVHTDLMKTQALLHALDKYKFDAAFGSKAEITPFNIIDTKQFEVKIPDISIKLSPAAAERMETKVIDGQKYILIRADGTVEVNGVEISIS